MAPRVTQTNQQVLLVHLNNPKKNPKINMFQQLGHKPGVFLLSFLQVNHREPTFCHAPRILATSDLLPIHLDHHVASDNCQRHFLLKWGKQ